MKKEIVPEFYPKGVKFTNAHRFYIDKGIRVELFQPYKPKGTGLDRMLAASDMLSSAITTKVVGWIPAGTPPLYASKLMTLCRALTKGIKGSRIVTSRSPYER